MKLELYRSLSVLSHLIEESVLSPAPLCLAVLVRPESWPSHPAAPFGRSPSRWRRAAFPTTTQVSSLCAMVIPPAALMAPNPSAPSSPIPVIRHAHGESDQFLGHGVKQHIHRGPVAIDRRPVGKPNHFPARACVAPSCDDFLGKSATRPASSKSPDCASCTSIAQISSNRRANISVKPSGMCCTITKWPENRGDLRQKYCNALGPPVEIPIAIMRFGAMAASGAIFRRHRRFHFQLRQRLIGPPARFATLIFSPTGTPPDPDAPRPRPGLWPQNRLRPAPAL